jgi:glutamine synthetase
LIPGYEAPVYAVWGKRNRAALVRLPSYKPDKEGSTRIEYRAPDAACNPYLFLAVALAAGLDGVERELELAAESQDDIYAMSIEERRALGLEALPDTLEDALELMEGSELVAEALGEHVFEWFLRNKREEWEEYKSYVTPFELNRYLPML